MSLPREITVVGPGRVGSVFVRAAARAGVPCTVATRADPSALGRPRPDLARDVPAPPGGGTPHPDAPILVCTRADDLDGVINATDPANRPDLVFVQNGMIAPMLRARGLGANTQGLIYFAATSREGPVQAGAPSLFFGPHAPAIVALLAADGIPARVVPDAAAFAYEIAVKLTWNVIFGLLGERFGESVGETVTRRPGLVAALVDELAPVLGAALGADVPPAALLDRIVAYSAGIPEFRAAVRELPWRNGFVVAAARAQGRATPAHDALLRETGHA